MRVLSLCLAVVAVAKGPTEEAAGSETSCYKSKDNGQTYRGLVSHTASGRTCQSWTSQHPHRINVAEADDDADGLGNHNFCRNPSGSQDKPFCYTMDSNKETEACNIPECPEDSEVEDLGNTRTKLSAAMNWHDCECADQLFGSTETTRDTSVAGDFLQKNVNRRGAKGKCRCH
mmetsp:Transcript_31960/g.69987  ORF Transcript_31960/g.69987 Transcript_31960/m.69987 type:complete len:174 (-) Transcript_31960:27-548(-)